ncbi:MAG: UbiX family flavin prenyltransferase [Planctomycetota bacterium]|jgi:4-hydroxy-3-polyprenylbenzoate decarboxylase
MTSRIVIGITGASGAVYARRVMELLAIAGVEMHLTVSGLGRRLLFDELDMKRVDPDALTGGHGELVTVYNDNDVGAAIASGSFLHDGMLIVPCSANTMGAIAAGLGDNLVKRAAAVALKERRRLILGYREMPASHVDVCNMQRLSEAGAVIAPLSPGFYLLPRSIDDLVDFVAGRLLDLLGVDHSLDTRWEEHAAAVRGKDPSPPAAAGSP